QSKLLPICRRYDGAVASDQNFMIDDVLLGTEEGFANGDLLFDHFGVAPFVAHSITRRIVRIELFDVEILHVLHEIRHRQRNIIVVAYNDSGSAYERYSRRMITAVRDLDVNLMPYGRNGQSLMRIAFEDRLPG